MFGFGKPKLYDEDFDYDAVVSRYEGEMVVGDYVAETLNRSEGMRNSTCQMPVFKHVRFI